MITFVYLILFPALGASKTPSPPPIEQFDQQLIQQIDQQLIQQKITQSKDTSQSISPPSIRFKPTPKNKNNNLISTSIKSNKKNYEQKNFDKSPLQPMSINNKTNFWIMELNSFYNLSIKQEDTLLIENKNILNVKDNRNQLVLQGKREGSTLFKVNSQTYKIVVVSKEKYNSFLKLKTLLDNLNDLSLDFEDGMFVIEGLLDNPATWISISKLHLSHFKFQASVTLSQLKVVENYLNSELIQKNLFPITLTLDPGPTVWLHPNAVKNISISNRIKYFGLNIKEDTNKLVSESLVRVQVLLVELRKSFAQNLGIEWPYEFSAKLAPGGLLPKGSDTSWLAHFIATKGQGRVLANPILITRSGSEAEFFAGGEFPIKTKTNQTQTIYWKKYGINLKIKPNVDTEGKISLTLNSEISSIDAGEKNDGIPSLFTNNLSSHFDLHQSQTVALSGLIKKIDGQSTKQWPGWGEIPILGSLFSSREYQEDKTELIVFVTPTIIQPSNNFYLTQ